MRFIGLFVALVALAGCGSGSPTVETAVAPVPPAAPEKKSPTSEFRVEVNALEQPNQYRAVLKWENPATGRCVVDREDVARHERKDFREFDCSVGTFQDDTCIAGRRYRYRLRAVEAVGAIGESSAELTIPMDLVLRGEHVVPSLEGISRLFLVKGAKLRTEGLSWRGRLEELVAEDALLEVLPAPQLTAPAGSDGRSAGSIDIRTRRARGSLVLRLLGQNGGAGLPGQAGVAGKDGVDGKKADVDVDPNKTFAFPFLVTRREEFRKMAWDGVEFPGNVRSMMKCIEPATAGTAGSNGTAGTAGTPGGRGGNSPRTLLVVESGEQFSWSRPSVAGGLGGAGGPGGIGGVGGKAGKPGATDKAGICAEVAPLADGEKGADGVNGARGIDGRDEPVCVVVAGSKSGDCEAFEAELKN